MLVREVLRFVHGPHREPNASARHPIPAAKCALIRPAHDDVIQESRSAIFSQWKERHRAESCPPVIKITISFFTYSCEKWQPKKTLPSILARIALRAGVSPLLKN